MTENKWTKIFEDLPDEELTKLAILRVMECCNGIIQFMYRNGDPEALSLEETRTAMKFLHVCYQTYADCLGK